jgi:hypothetical protein
MTRMSKEAKNLWGYGFAKVSPQQTLSRSQLQSAVVLKFAKGTSGNYFGSE